jgi:hypothetical protein
VWHYPNALRLDVGKYTLQVRATDRASNNQSDAASVCFTIVKPPAPSKNRGGGGGLCFVATCCGETPDGSFIVRDTLGKHTLSYSALEDVRALRTFRDEVLAHGAFGRSLRSGYYTVGPVVAATATESPTARAILQYALIKPLALIARDLTGESHTLKLLLLALMGSVLAAGIARRHARRVR